MFLSPADRSGARGRRPPGPAGPEHVRPGAGEGWLAAPLADAAISAALPLRPASRINAPASVAPGSLGRVGQVGQRAGGIVHDIITEAEAGLAQASVRSGGCFVRPLPLDSTCASAARSFFREAVSGADLHGDLVHDGLTMASELAANTLNAHGNVEFGGRSHRPVSGGPEFWLYVRSVGQGREIVCKIFDSDPGWDAGEPAPIGAAVPAGPDSVRGRGLQIVAGLSAGNWGHHPSRGRLGAWKVPGKAVWFALRVPPGTDLAGSARLAPPGLAAMEELVAALADRGLGAGLVQVNEPGGELAVLSVSQHLTVWCHGDIIWWQDPDGSYDRLHVADLVEATERIVCAHEELMAARTWSDGNAAEDTRSADPSAEGGDEPPAAAGET